MADFEGELTVEKLQDFIEAHRFPVIMAFDQKVAQKIFSENQPALFLITQHDEASVRAEAALREVAHKLKGHI